MPEVEERWTVTFHSREASLCEEVAALAASQKAAEVETRTGPLLFGPGCAHHSEMLFRHTAVLSTVILHQPRERAFVPAWHQHICLENLTLLGCNHQLHLQQEPLNQICVLKPLQPSFSAMLFLAAVPELPVCLLGHRGESVGFPQR